jgi:hypothetical protein
LLLMRLHTSTAMMSAPSCASRTAWLRPWPRGTGDESDLAFYASSHEIPLLTVRC